MWSISTDTLKKLVQTKETKTDIQDVRSFSLYEKLYVDQHWSEITVINPTIEILILRKNQTIGYLQLHLQLINSTTEMLWPTI